MQPTRPNWTKIREALWARCGGRCEVSGRFLAPETFDAHHRRNKGMGGTSRGDRDALFNLLALDPQVHNGGPASVHGRRIWSEANGYLVPKHDNHPELYPVLLHTGELVLLTPTGGYLPIKT